MNEKQNEIKNKIVHIKDIIYSLNKEEKTAGVVLYKEKGSEFFIPRSIIYAKKLNAFFFIYNYF